jgi:hypothetical protein
VVVVSTYVTVLRNCMAYSLEDKAPELT